MTKLTEKEQELLTAYREGRQIMVRMKAIITQPLNIFPGAFIEQNLIRRENGKWDTSDRSAVQVVPARKDTNANPK